MPTTESTPLLARESSPFPTVSAALSLLGNRFDRAAIEEVCPRDVGDIGRETAFRLVVLLKLRAKQLRRKPPADQDIWNHYALSAPTEDVLERLDDLVLNNWDLFLDRYRTTAEIEHVLWTPFPVDDAAIRTVSVVDMLNDNSPSQLVCHEVVLLSLTNLWRHGPARENFVRATTSSGIGLRYDAVCTPRVLHAMDLAAHLSYFGLLVSFLLHPPSQPVISHEDLEYVGAREILFMLLAASILSRPRMLFNIPFAITLLIFLLNLPAVPFAGTFSFGVLLLCFAFHAFQFHFPGVPSPLFLITVHHSLPFAGFLAHGFLHIIYPIVLYFAPIGFLATYWLSLALADTFFMPPSFVNSSAFAPTPIETRTTVLMMFFAMCFVVFCSLFIFVVQGRALDDTKFSPWDVYSPRIGRDARAFFLRAIIVYGRYPYTFPAPFSLLQALMITGPSFILVRLGFRLPFAQAQKVLWRIFVAPVGLLFALAMLPLP